MLSDTTSHDHDQPRISGSRRFDKVVLAPTSTSLGSSKPEEALRYRLHRDPKYVSTSSQGTYPPVVSSHPAEFAYSNTCTKDIAARKVHNVLQPITRLSADVLEYLFLLGAALAFSSPSRPSPTHPSIHFPTSIHHRDSPTRTILTYAQLTSPLRRVALSSPRLWVRLIDFEHASERWTDELLRRSTGVSVEVVFQWSKALGSSPHFPRRADRSALLRRRKEEEEGKRTRLESMLRHDVLARARSVGVAVPAPYFADILMDKLSSFGGDTGRRRLDRLETLRIVRSRPRRASENGDGREAAEAEGDDEEQPAGYVPLAILEATPRLRELAIAESSLPFHDLLPYFTTSSAPPPPNAPSQQASVLPDSRSTGYAQALHTLSHLRCLHIVDLPLHLAPSAREWLTYLCATPALEELVLEGAVLGVADLGARMEERMRLRDQTDTRANWDESEGDVGSAQEQHIASDRLPTLRVLILDAALEDVGVLVGSLPLPFPPHLKTLEDRRGETVVEPEKKYEWTLRCADSHAGEVEGLGRIMGVLSRAAGLAGGSAPQVQQGGRGGAQLDEKGVGAELSLALSATETDVYVHLRSGSPGPRFSAHLHLHMSSSSPAPTLAPFLDASGTSVQRPSASLVNSVLGSLEAAIMPRLTSLEVDLPPSTDTSPLRNSLARAAKVARLGLGRQGAKGVLKMLQTGPDGRRGSVSSCKSSSSSSSASPSSTASPTASSGNLAISHRDAVLLPALKVLTLADDGAGGPVWTALLRCLKARRSAGAPVASVNFASGSGGGGRMPLTYGTMDDNSGPTVGNILATDRMRELQGLSVSVKVDREGEGYLF